MDLVLGNADTMNYIFLNPGDGDFSEVVPIAIGQQTDDTRSVVIADVTGDGYKDILVGNAGTANLLYENPGPPNYFKSTALHQEVSGDVDHMTPGPTEVLPSEGSYFSEVQPKVI